MREFLHMLRDSWDNREDRWSKFKEGVSEVPARWKAADKSVKLTLVVLIAFCIALIAASII